MTYKLKEEAANWEGIPGVPWRDMTDKEFKEVSTAYDEQFPEEPGSLKRWFDHVRDEKAEKEEDK